MGSGGRASEVKQRSEALRLRSLFRRRTSSQLWCGVAFFCLLAGCESSQTGITPPARRVLTIGVPESGVNGPELGIGSLIASSTLEGLTQVNVSADGRALPRLAEAWEWENGGRRLRMKLREGVEFHDGTVLTAAAIAEALKAAIAQGGNRALYPSLTDINDVRPNGPLELVLELAQPSAFLPEELDLPLALDRNVGTGPFRLVRRDSTGAVLERFDRYYLGTPIIDQIVIRPFDTLRTAWTSLLRGEVDMVTDVPPEAVEFIRNDDIQVIPFARNYQFLIAFNSASAPFRSPDVRRALNLAVDRDNLILNVLQGQGRAATGPLWPQHWAYDSSIQPFTFDADLAESLLNDAGFTIPNITRTTDLPPARLHFTCLVPADFSVLERIALNVQKQLFDVGVDMQFEVVSLAEYDSRIREKDFEAVLVDLSSGPSLARANVFWRPAQRQPDGLNVFGYDNPDAERFFQILNTSLNEARIRSATRGLQRVLLEDPPALFLAWNARARAVSRAFTVVGPSGRDPLLTVRQWTENIGSQAVASP